MKINNVSGFKNYNREVTEKNFICIHTTGGHNVKNVINWWKTRNDGDGTISTPFIIDKKGIIHQLFSPQYWSHHTGKGKFIDKQTIGIEIENAGVCKINDKFELYNDIGVKADSYTSWVGADNIQYYHESITKAQWMALVELVMTLSMVFAIKPIMTNVDELTIDKNSDFGVFTHRQVNDSKTDIPIEMFENAIENGIQIPFIRWYK